MTKVQLERLAIEAVKEHRRLLEADQILYEDWENAHADKATRPHVVTALQEQYVARQKKSETQQEELSEIIDALGYVPDVSSNGDE